MKLVTFVKAGEERLGLLAGDTVIDPLLAPATSRAVRERAEPSSSPARPGIERRAGDPGQSAEGGDRWR